MVVSRTPAPDCRWPNVDMDRRLIEWPSATDKMGHERRQALPRDAVRTLRIARVWARRAGYAGDLVFFGAKSARRRRTSRTPIRPSMLRCYAPRRPQLCPISPIARCTATAARRAATCWTRRTTPYQAMEWLGQTDLRSTMRYLKKRDVRQRELARIVAAPEHEAKPEQERQPKTNRPALRLAGREL